MLTTLTRIGIGPCLAALAVALFTTACRTPAPPKTARAAARIALLSDLHVTRGTNADPALYDTRATKAIEMVNAAQVDLVLISGDLTENGYPWELADFRRKISGFNAPVWHVPGNHDVGNKRLGKNRREVGFGTVRDYELQNGRSYYVREHAGVRVVAVNSALLGSKLPQERRQWEMLETALEKTNALPTLLMLHHPPFVKTTAEPGGEYWNVEPYPRARLLALCRQGGVKAVLSGHLHRSVTNEVDGIFYWTTPPISFGLPKGKQAEGWTLITLSQGEVKFEFNPIPKIAAPAPATKPRTTTAAKTKSK